MKKNNFKKGLGFALFCGVLNALLLLGFKYISGKPDYSFILFESLFFAIFFGTTFPMIMRWSAKKFAAKVKTPELEESEVITFEDGANLFRGKFNAVGGKLFLTNKRLVFNSHNLNINGGQVSIGLEEIEGVTKRKSGGIVDNGLRLKTKNNDQFDFVVNERKEWVKKLGASLN